MSNATERAAEDQYEAQNDSTGGDIPSGIAGDNDYKSRTGQSEIPVQSDDAPVEEPMQAPGSNSDAQLAADDNEAIDQSNIIGSRTRGAGKPSGTYTEPGDEEGLPSTDGTSSTA